MHTPRSQMSNLSSVCSASLSRAMPVPSVALTGIKAAGRTGCGGAASLQSRCERENSLSELQLKRVQRHIRMRTLL